MAQHPSDFYYDDQTLRLTQAGKWLIDGEEILHQRTVDTLFRSIKRYSNGYWIEIGSERKQIEVEDTPYFVIGLSGDTKQGFTLTLSDSSKEALEPSTLKLKETRLTCPVKDGTDEARFLFGAYHQLLQSAEQDEKGFFLKIQGKVSRL